jgi:8-oxo-dGTP diphosphatase
MYQETKTHEVTVDVVILTTRNKKLQVLLIQRGLEPFLDKWSIPGGFIRLSEDLDDAAERVLYEKTRVKNVHLSQLHTFGNPTRYPKSRVITVAYCALIRSDELELDSDLGTGVKDIKWHSVYNLPPLAFDHKEIISHAIDFLRENVEHKPVAFQLLPKKFTLTQLQKTYEMILNKEIDKRNFRKKILSSNILTELTEVSKEGSKRPARLYSFNKFFLDNHQNDEL